MALSFNLVGNKTGLITASAIYVGLLAYISYFDSDKVASVDDQIASQTVEQKGEIKQPIITPLAKGIFESEAIPKTKDTLSLPVDEAKLLSNKDEQPTATPSPLAQNDRISSSPVSGVINYSTTAYKPMYRDHPDFDRFDLMNRQQFYSDMAQHHYQNAYGQGRGRGYGNGNMDGEGEFDFNMSFRSRAHMEADTEADADSDYYSNNAARYYQDAYLHPAYRGYYYSRY